MRKLKRSEKQARERWGLFAESVAHVRVVVKDVFAGILPVYDIDDAANEELRKAYRMGVKHGRQLASRIAPNAHRFDSSRVKAEKGIKTGEAGQNA